MIHEGCRIDLESLGLSPPAPRGKWWSPETLVEELLRLHPVALALKEGLFGQDRQQGAGQLAGAVRMERERNLHREPPDDVGKNPRVNQIEQAAAPSFAVPERPSPGAPLFSGLLWGHFVVGLGLGSAVECPLDIAEDFKKTNPKTPWKIFTLIAAIFLPNS